MEHGDEPCYVYKMVSNYVTHYLQPLSPRNISYLMSQMKWPHIIIEGRDETAAAYHREMLRILRYRLLGMLPRVRRLFEPVVDEQLRDRIIREQWAERVERGEQEHVDNPQWRDLLRPWLFEELDNVDDELAERFDELL